MTRAPVRSNLLLGPIRGLAGAARLASTGEEALMVDGFIARRARRVGGRVFMTEVPTGGGVVDLVEMRLAPGLDAQAEAAEPALRSMALIPDQDLYALAALRLGVAYSSVRPLGSAALLAARRSPSVDALLRRDGDAVYRQRMFPDDIEEVHTYEFKVSLSRPAVVQAARRRTLASQAWIVAHIRSTTAEAHVALARGLGLGLIDADDWSVRVRPTCQGRPQRWARFDLARQLARGIYGASP